MKTTNKTIMEEENVMKSIKLGLAAIIIAMGSYGYYRFFSSADSTEPTWLVVFLFIIIETAILTMTTMHFSSALKQTKSVGAGLFMAITVMWLISGVGIDQTIWGMVESKYHAVKLDETAVIADKETETLLSKRITQLQSQQIQYKNEVFALEKSKSKVQKAYDKTVRQLKDIIWYNGKRCDLSTDCTARKNIAQNALNLVKQELDDYTLSIKTIKENIIANNKSIAKAKSNTESIIQNRVEFEKRNRVTLENKKEEALVHVKLMDLLNILGLKIETPERAYVMLLSFVIYPIYILFIAFVSSNTQEMKSMRQKLQLDKLQEATGAQKNNTAFKALMVIAGYLRKIIGYLISTRARKVVVKEVEIEVEVSKEVEKIVYKDGKEIVKVEIEVPHVIEKEIIVEKIVERPVIEKEFITIPADIDLNEFNKIAGYGNVPTSLSDYLNQIKSSAESDSNRTKNRSDVEEYINTTTTPNTKVA